MYLICIFLPAIISMVIDQKIYSNKRSLRDFVLVYCCYLFIICMLVNTIFLFIEDANFVYSTKLFTYSFCAKYMWISFIIAIILPYIIKCFKEAISINIEVREKKKEEKTIEKEVRENESKKKVSNAKKKKKNTSKKER